MMDTIVIQAPPGTKARWVRTAHPGKLSAWVVKMIDEEPMPDRYMSRFATGHHGALTFTESELLALMKQVYIAGAKRE